MLKKAVALAVTLSLCFCLFSVSAASRGTVPSAGSALSPEVPTSGVMSPDPDHASGIYNTGSAGSNRMSPMATGLLAVVSLEVYLVNGNTILLEGTTDATEVLNKIGYQNITLQRYENGQWTNLKVWSTYKTNAYYYDYDYETTVTEGYYYRFTATHYGENDWLIFSSVQTVYNETSYIYV